MGTDGSLLFLTQKVKPSSVLSTDVGRVLDASSGSALGTFAFAGGWTPNAELSIYSGDEALAQTGTRITAVRLSTSGWTPPAVALAVTPDGQGYWLAGQDGGVFSYGDAPFEGSLPGLGIQVNDIVGITATPDGLGYWLVGADGGVFAFGDAPFYGSAASRSLQQPVVGIAATADGGGYWLVAADGGVFAYGDAPFYGSAATTTGSIAEFVGISPTPDGGGYWLLGTDGGVFAFGDAGFYGSRG